MLSSEKKIVEQRAPGAVYDALPILGFPVAPTRTQNQRNTTKSFKSLLSQSSYPTHTFVALMQLGNVDLLIAALCFRVLTVSMCTVSAKGVEADPEPNDRAVNRGAPILIPNDCCRARHRKSFTLRTFFLDTA